MKKFSKAAIPAVLASAMIITALPATAFAEESDTSSDQATSSAIEALTEAMISNDDPYASKSDDVLDTYIDDETDSAIEAYDLTDGHIMKACGVDIDEENIKDIVTPVKLQNPYGTCWGFAATAAAEGSIVGELKEKDETVDPRDNAYNFSEKYLTWFFANCLNSETSGHTEYASQDGEGRHWKDGTNSYEKYIGGVMSQATALYASGLGPVYEFERNEETGEWEDCIYTYKGVNGNIYYQLDASNNLYRYSYDDQDDWSIADTERFYQNYQLEESYLLPTPAKIETNEETGKDEYIFNEEGLNAIKEELRNNRPVAIGFYADQSQPNQQGESKYINQNTWAQYTYDCTESANHAVTIVGYDDNYPASNFNSGHQPEKDGAFLVKNSWGSGEEEFPNKGDGSWGIEVNGTGTGYFWLSYYDQTICLPESLNFETENESTDSYILNQYDFMPAASALCTPAQDADNNYEMAKLANVFTANEGAEKIFAMSCQTGTPGTEVTYEIVLLRNDSENPEDGYVIYKDSETYKYGGYHRYEIPEGYEVAIPEGGKYAIVCTLKEPATESGEDKYDIYLNWSEGNQSGHDSTWCEGVINPGESYLYTESEGWGDLSEFAENLKESLYIQEKIKYEFDNFAIKAYASPIEDNDLTLKINSLNGFSITYYPGKENTATINAFVTGSIDPTGKDYDFHWYSSDDSIVKVVSENGFKCTVEAVDYGTASLVFYCPQAGYSICSVTVTKIPIDFYFADIEFTKATYTGKAIKPTVELQTFSGDVVDPSNYKVTYSNNINAGTATVTLEGIGDYSGTKIRTFTIEKAAQKITNYKNVKKTYNANKKTKKLAKKKTFKLSAKSSVGAKVTYTKVSGNKKITVSSSGKVTVKKGLKKGTYKVKVKATAKATTNYNASKAVTKTITIKVK